MFVQRPISPHLQIYKPQVTSVMSIMHRLSGLANAVGLLLISVLFIAAPYGDSTFEAVAAVLTSWPGLVVLALFVLSVCYHLCNGIRHLTWDTGLGLTMPTLRKSAVVALAAAAVLALLVVLQ
ncbi:MAG: succinate dehydrogenase, cytochrome b556 subunit [Proteobacteria bacterium]|nr:MAG: succinate dehydrogenase, cytochrome b556 subunit [Pseudomonadota bacterium]